MTNSAISSYLIDRIADIVDCISCAASVREQSPSILSVLSSLGQDQRIRGAKSNEAALTIIVRSHTKDCSATDVEQPRLISLQLPTRGDSNFLLSAMRTLIAASPPHRTCDRIGAIRSLRPENNASKQREVK